MPALMWPLPCLSSVRQAIVTSRNLDPSGVRKGGAGLDLPIAVALLVADGQLAAAAVGDAGFLGELGLDGSLRRVVGTLSLLHSVGRATVVVPPACAAEA